MLTFVLFLLFEKRNARSRDRNRESVRESLVASDLAPAEEWVANHLTGQFRMWNVGVSNEPRTRDRSTCLEVTIPSQKDVNPRFAKLIATLA